MSRLAHRVTPQTSEALAMTLLGRERLSPHLVRLTLRDDAGRFPAVGLDQWFRLFIPVEGAEDELGRLPDRLTTAAYLRLLLTVPRSRRPVLRSYTVRAHRPASLTGSGDAELDLDVVVHGESLDHGAGPGSLWAQQAEPGSPVAVLDEGTLADRAALTDGGPVLVVADESALPATAGVLAALPASATGTAVVEVPTDADRQVLDAPAGIDVQWVTRGTGPSKVPGREALARLATVEVPPGAACWTAGEQSLVRDVRRHLVAAGLPKDRVSFQGYWRVGRSG